MLTRVVLPHLATNLPRAVVSEWHVVTGDEVRFGTPLCDVSVSDRVRVSSGSSRANVLIRAARRGMARSSQSELESDRFQVRYRVVASEPVTIVELRADAGSVVEVGGVLAIGRRGGEGGEEHPIEISQMPTLRVVASILAPEGS